MYISKFLLLTWSLSRSYRLKRHLKETCLHEPVHNTLYTHHFQFHIVLLVQLWKIIGQSGRQSKYICVFFCDIVRPSFRANDLGAEAIFTCPMGAALQNSAATLCTTLCEPFRCTTSCEHRGRIWTVPKTVCDIHLLGKGTFMISRVHFEISSAYVVFV